MWDQRPDAMDAVQRTFFARVGTVEEFDGVWIERESLEHLDRLLREGVVEVKDVDADVHDASRSNDPAKEEDHSNHHPVAWLKRDLTEVEQW